MWRRLRQCSLGMRWHRSVMTDIQLVKVSLTKKKEKPIAHPRRRKSQTATPERNAPTSLVSCISFYRNLNSLGPSNSLGSYTFSSLLLLQERTRSLISLLKSTQTDFLQNCLWQSNHAMPDCELHSLPVNHRAAQPTSSKPEIPENTSGCWRVKIHR